MSRYTEYKVSERVTLKAGDYFRARGGPYYKSPETGNRSSFAERGPFKFLAYCAVGKRKWIEAFSVREGTMAILSLEKRRKTILPGSLIHRPYEILGGVGKKRKERLDAVQAGKKESFRKPSVGKRKSKKPATSQVASQSQPIVANSPKTDPQDRLADGVGEAFGLVNSVLEGEYKT